jgi:predicted transcriptional regulator of viral defense system
MRREVRHHGALAELAATQYGVISQRQMGGLGYSEGAIARAEIAGRLHRMHHGVYAVGHPAPSRHGRYLAAVLACGEGALISHGSAAWLWGLSPEYLVRAEVTVPARGHNRAAICRHHSTILEESDRAVCDGVPTTAVPRTLLDLAATPSGNRLERVIEKAERLGLLDLGAIDDLVQRSGRHAGRKRLRAALAIYRDPAMTRSRLERLFIDLVRRARLPRPAINTFVAGHEIDAYWERERFAVELDGYETHGTRAAFERDPVRIEDLKLAGIDAIRITARRVEREPDRVAARLRALLER